MKRGWQLLPALGLFGLLLAGCYSRPAYRPVYTAPPVYGGYGGYNRPSVTVVPGGGYDRPRDSSGRTRGGFSTPSGSGSVTLRHQGGFSSGSSSGRSGGGFSRPSGGGGSRSRGFSR